MSDLEQFDIAIIGAGPSGCSAALTLQHSDCRVVLFDKAKFPRNKICGDGLCDRTINTLRVLSPQYFEEFMALKKSLCINSTKLFYKNHSYDINFKSVGYTCKRNDFDNFLFSLVERDCSNVTICQNSEVSAVDRIHGGMKLQTADGREYFAKIILVCNGASSKLTENLLGTKTEKSDMGVAVRAYYSGVKNMTLDAIELHYKKEYFPGYLWIFPMADGLANVGFGCNIYRKDKDKESIQSIFDKWINEDEILRERFASAHRETSLQGGLIPYNTDTFNCYGDNFFICGDAAHLVDPISGGGIGSAMLSGNIAAQQAMECVKQKDFSKSLTKEYSIKFRKRVEREMHIRYKLQRVISRNLFLLDILAFVGKQSRILTKIKTWYLDK